MTNPTEIQTNGRTLVVVPVPAKSANINLYQIYISKDRYLKRIEWENGTASPFNSKDIGVDNYNLLGYLTKDEISFDVEPYVEKSPYWYKEGLFVDYVKLNIGSNINEKANQCGTPEQSFRSLLQSQNIYFTNKFGEKPKPMVLVGGLELLVDNERNRRFAEKIKQWNEAQSHVIEKCVILEKI